MCAGGVLLLWGPAEKYSSPVSGGRGVFVGGGLRPKIPGKVVGRWIAVSGRSWIGARGCLLLGMRGKGGKLG